MADCNVFGVKCPSNLPTCQMMQESQTTKVPSCCSTPQISFNKIKNDYCNSNAQHDIRTSTNVIAPNNAIMTTSLSLLPRDLGLEAPQPLSKLPESLSWMEKGGDKISRVSDQCGCGCCWAMASTQALADRFGLKYDAVAPELAPAWTALGPGVQNGMKASCQCEGGTLQLATCGFIRPGARLEKYYPLKLLTRDSCGENNSNGGPVPVMLNTDPDDCGCGDKKNSCTTSTFLAKRNSQKIIVSCTDGNINAQQTHAMIKHELLNYGPCAVTFFVRDRFMDDYYKSSLFKNATKWEEVPIYDPTGDENKKLDGGHAVVITGWGSKDNMPYWEVRNSWGIFGKDGQWGGYFKYRIVSNDPNHLSVPSFTNNTLSGGAVTCQAGDKWPTGVKKIKGKGGKLRPGHYVPPHDSSNNKKSSGPNWLLIILISVAVCVVIAIIAVVLRKR